MLDPRTATLADQERRRRRKSAAPPDDVERPRREALALWRAGSAEAARQKLEAATALLDRRLTAPPGDDRERARAFGILIRAGYESEVAYDAIRACGGGGADVLAA